MFTARSFYGSKQRPSTLSLDEVVESLVPNDGVESDDPDWGGRDEGAFSSDSDWYDDGKCMLYT